MHVLREHSTLGAHWMPGPQFNTTELDQQRKYVVNCV